MVLFADVYNYIQQNLLIHCCGKKIQIKQNIYFVIGQYS